MELRALVADLRHAQGYAASIGQERHLSSLPASDAKLAKHASEIARVLNRAANSIERKLAKEGAASVWARAGNREMARRLGMSPSYLSKLFSGVSELRLDHVIRICREAGLEPQEFFSIAYPRQPAGSSAAARKLRELLQTIQIPPAPAAKPAPTLDDEKQVEEMLKLMLEKLLGRKSETV